MEAPPDRRGRVPGPCEEGRGAGAPAHVAPPLPVSSRRVAGTALPMISTLGVLGGTQLMLLIKM